MKKRSQEAMEALLLALPCALQGNEELTESERVAGWRIFEKVLREYSDTKHRSRKGACRG